MLTKIEEKALRVIEEAINNGTLPSFPVTQTKRASLDYFTNVWIKDESTQETGTHKDRMAWEIISVYLNILKNKEKELNGFHKSLPHFSIISAGSAALAIQTQLRKYYLPNLKILVDQSTNKGSVDYLKTIGCEVFATDLNDRMLSSQDILALTNNPEGFDLTSNTALDPDLRFYDWMSYEILNENPEYVFVPYGTGQLYENILNIAKKVLKDEEVGPLYTGDRNLIYRCHFIGATSNDPNTLAVKLYAPFRPFTKSSLDWLQLFMQQGYCGEQSRISEVSEEFIIKGNYILKSLGISSEYSGSAALGFLYQIKDEIPKNAKILIVNTGKAKFP